MIDATGSAPDPAAGIRLLWRHHIAEPPRRGPRRSLDVDTVVRAATEIADEEGLTALSMRRLAERVGVRPMSLYTYVPGRGELLDLMLDEAYARMPRPAREEATPWQEKVRRIADLNLDLHRRHPWTTRLSTLRPPLGPGQLAKYEYELAAFDGAGLDDVTVDDALTYLLGFVRNAALDVQAAEDIAAADGRTDDEWWAHAGPVLADLVSSERYPRAARIGAAAGAARGSAHDPAHAYRFGLDLTIDAIAMRRSG